LFAPGLPLLVASVAALAAVVEFFFDSVRQLPKGYMDGPIKVAAIAALIQYAGTGDVSATGLSRRRRSQRS
jgi:hypothetical protein